MATAPIAVRHGHPSRGPRALLQRLRSGDEAAHLITALFAGSVILITSLLVYELWANSVLSRHRFGWSFLFSRVWDPVFEQFGALPFIYGTLVTSAVALLIAVPVGLGAAIFLAELAPPRLSDGLAFVIDLLAAVPSVIYGLMAIFTLVPLLRERVEPGLGALFGFLPLFQGPVWSRLSRRRSGPRRYGSAVHHFRFP